MSKVLVNIHGAGKQMSDFFKAGLAALTELLEAEPEHIAVWYADLSNIGSPVFGVGEDDLPPDAQAFRAALRQELRQRRNEIEAQLPPGAAEFGAFDWAVVIGDLLADVTRYLFDTELQTTIKQRLFDALDQAVEKYDESIIVSHSLGTVVAFDVLRERADRYNVTKLLTMGSPLRKVVRLGARSSDVGAMTSSTLTEWRNLYDTTDPVADPIRPVFPGYPIEDIFVQNAHLPIASHEYWSNPQVLGMIADTLRD